MADVIRWLMGLISVGICAGMTLVSLGLYLNGREGSGVLLSLSAIATLIMLRKRYRLPRRVKRGTIIVVRRRGF